MRVSIVCKGPGFRLSFSKCFLSTCHKSEHYWTSLGRWAVNKSRVAGAVKKDNARSGERVYVGMRLLFYSR